MPELAQWMIDGGATFFDAAGNPTRPDGTPVQQGLLGELATQAAPRAQPGPPQNLEINTENPLGYAFGPGYAPSNLDSVDSTPLAPTIWNLGQEAPPDNATQYLDYSHGDPFPANWEDYKSTDRSTAGGFFTAGELYGADLPGQFGRGRDAPSTNNWRLLPTGKPGYIMRNGNIINLNSTQLYGPYGPVPTNQEGSPPWKSGINAGSPVAHAWGHGNQMIGWPGQLGPYWQDGTAAS
jgi:hypothetical protein